MAKKFSMPKERDFGWALKSTDTTCFEFHKKPNGQFCVVLNHSLLRGVSSEMIYWWFKHFTRLQVQLLDVPGYEAKKVPGYLLWHPSDHCKASLSGDLGPNGTAQTGAKIHIQEAMQYAAYGMKYPVDTDLNIFYCENDGWAMGKQIPLFGKVMCLRIHFKDVVKDRSIIGAHYHYEVVIGANGNNPIVHALNKKITGEYSAEFFAAWHLHNTIEVGTFENFLPALFEQRSNLTNLNYETSMDAMAGIDDIQSAQSPALFNERLSGFKTNDNPYHFQQAESASFI